MESLAEFDLGLKCLKFNQTLQAARGKALKVPKILRIPSLPDKMHTNTKVKQYTSASTKGKALAF